MKRILIEDLGEIACHMYDSIVDDGLNDVTFVGYYKDAVCLVKELLMFDDVDIFQIEVEPVERDGYDMEYYIILDNELNIWCEKAYSFNHGRYLYNETSRLFIADDCNSAILNEIGCDEDNMYEVSYDLDDDGCDGDCANCKYAENPYLEKPDDEIGRLLKGNDTHEVITRVATDENGKLRGFEKSWETKEDGLNYKSTYTYYSNNENMLKNMLENFEIKY